MRINSKLAEILLSFSEDDWDKFLEFARKHDSVSRRKYAGLAVEFRRQINKSGNAFQVNAGELFANAYGRSKHNPQTLYNRQSELLSLCKSFLADISFRSHEFLTDQLLSAEMLKRKLLKNYEGFRITRDKISEKYLFREDAYRYLMDFSLDEAGYFQLSEKVGESLKSYKKFSDILLAEALNNIIKAQTELSMIQKIYNVKFDDVHYAGLLNSLESAGFFREIENSGNKKLLFPLIRYYVYKSMSPENFREYSLAAERVFSRNEELFSENFRMEIYRKLISSYLNKVNAGEKKYFRDIFRLVKRKLRQNLTEDIRRETGYNPFRDYVICGIALGKYKWVETIIKKYSAVLPEKTKYNETASALIRLHFARQEFDKVLEITGKIKTEDIIRYADISVYRLMALYEEKKFEECHTEISAVRKHIRKTEDYAGMVSALKLFLKAYKIILVNTGNPNLDAKQVKYSIGKVHGSYMRRDWINEKAELLAKNK